MVTSFDQKIILHVQKWRHPVLNKIFIYLTYTGTSRVWFSVALILNVLNFIQIQIVLQQHRFLHAMIAALMAWVSGFFLKKLFLRSRPSESISGYLRVIKSPSCGSFPSSHTAAAVAFYTALQIISHPLAPVVGVWALLVSFSRLYLGVHYLTDILGGAVLGILMAVILAYI